MRCPTAWISGRGVFVSLKKDGRLRGCIGTISPGAPTIADEIIAQCYQRAAPAIRGFDPVTEDELGALVYSVDVLAEPEADQFYGRTGYKALWRYRKPRRASRPAAAEP